MANDINEPGDNVVPIEAARKAAEPPPIDAEARTNLLRQFWTDVLMQIVDTPRFLEFMERNYTVMKGVDEDTKTVHVQVIEKPVGPAKIKLSVEQMMAIGQACLRNGIKNTSEFVRFLAKVLDVEEPGIVPATEEDFRKFMNQQDLKSKLDPV
jgi:hypothetical protein